MYVLTGDSRLTHVPAGIVVDVWVGPRFQVRAGFCVPFGLRVSAATRLLLIDLIICISILLHFDWSHFQVPMVDVARRMVLRYEYSV